MSARARALARMEVAGYHNDQRQRVRLIVESRINRNAMDAAWALGAAKKDRGWPCGCFECSRVEVSR